MIDRIFMADLSDRLSFYPGVVLLGARQVGKSTLARQVAAQMPGALFLDLELPADRAKLDNPAAFFAAHRDHLVVIDEVQTMPNLFVQLRPEIDADRRPGRFLLLGSASGVLLRQTAESLAGRVSYLELPPLLWSEVQAKVQPGGAAHQEATSDPVQQATQQLLALQSHWQRGGMPLSCLAKKDAQSLRWRNDYLQSVVRRDLPSLGIHIPSETLWRFLRMLAHQHGQLFNASALAVAMGGISPITVGRYLDIFCDALIVRKVEPYFVNLGKRLVKSPKVYFRDTGLLHALLGIGNAQDLQGHPMSGFSWEGLVVNHIAALLPLIAGGNASLHFFRTAAGAELDAVVDTGQERLGFEIKLSDAPRVTKGFWNACADLQVSRAYVVAPVSSSWPLSDKAQVIGLLDVGRVLGIVEP
ncbi:MAG: ATPase [Comamonadaceae bacterium PBBC1]|nr:MAG: ATPase [Comamonadaceae bacterium PBBC1]